MKFAPAPQTHRARVQDAIAQGPPPGDTLLTRYLAGTAGFGDRDGARALALLRDPSRRVRGIAICVVPLACDDAQGTEALRVMWSLRAERRLLRRMARHRRHAAIDAFLDELATDKHWLELVDDLPYGTAACVRRHLAHALARPSERFWSGLAQGHPGLLGEILIARWSETTGEADPVTRQLTTLHHRRIAELTPDAGLALAKVLVDRAITVESTVWVELVRRRTEAALELAYAQRERLPPTILRARFKELEPAVLARIMRTNPRMLGSFLDQVRKLRADQQRALAEAWVEVIAEHPTFGSHLLKYLPAGPARDEAFERWSIASRDQDGVTTSGLAELPLELAAREARRQVRDVVALGTQPLRRITGIARYLPWDELHTAVRDQLGHPEGANRTIALAELLANPGLYEDDATLPEKALALVTARKFEQDPVRTTMFNQLGSWPRRIWKAAYLTAVAQAVRDALDASDCSAGTGAAAERLVVRLFGVDPAWASTWLSTLIKERGTLHDPNLGEKLSDADVTAAAPALLAIAKTWTTQERAPWLLRFATGLGPRLALVPGLTELVVRFCATTSHEYYVVQGMDVLSRWAPAAYAEMLPAAVARIVNRRWYVSIIALAQQDGLVGRRQPRARQRRMPTLATPIVDALVTIATSLDRYHASSAISMLRKRAPEALDRLLPTLIEKDESVAIVADVHTWLHRHRQDLLAPYLDGRRIRGQWATGKTSWILPFADDFFRWTPPQAQAFADRLAAIVSDTERDTPTKLRSLEVLPRIEYAAQDFLVSLATHQEPALQEKAIRVLARCDAGQGVPTLLACLGDGRARFAIYGLRRALFNMLPDHALALLADAPMGKVTVAKEVVRLTGELRAVNAFPRLLELAASITHRDVRIAVLRALWDHLDREETWTIYERAVEDPDWVLASRLADIPANRLTVTLDARLAALLGRVLARPEPEARIDLLQRCRWLQLVDRDRTLLAACRARLASVHDDEVTAAMNALMARCVESDLPALGAALDALRSDPRSFHVAGLALCLHDVSTRASWVEAARQLEGAAAQDPRWAPLRVHAALARRQAPDVIAAVERTAATPGALDFDAANLLVTSLGVFTDAAIDEMATSLAVSPHAAARRLAVAILARAARPGQGWTPDRLALLAQLRTDTAPEVSGAAHRLWPPREVSP